MVNACTDLEEIEFGEKIYFEIIKKKIQITPQLYNCIINMYGKCNQIDKALLIFQSLQQTKRLNVYIWTTIITSFIVNN